MKKTFEPPAIQWEVLSVQDIITASPGTDSNGDFVFDFSDLIGR